MAYDFKVFRNVPMGDSGKSIPWQGIQFALVFFLVLGCARVSIDTKKPIQLDVKMRVDIYQHVAKDVASIEDMVSSETPVQKPDVVSWLFGVSQAYAQEEDYPQSVKDAIERRKLRKDELTQWLEKGVFGENNKGKVEVRDPGMADKTALAMMKEENADREMIYQYVADKNAASVASTAQVFSERIQKDAPKGTPIQTSDGRWTVKHAQ